MTPGTEGNFLIAMINVTKIGMILRLQGDWVSAVFEVIRISSHRSYFHSHVLCCTTLSCAHCLAQVQCPVSPPRDETSEPGRDHPLCHAVGVSKEEADCQM